MGSPLLLVSYRAASTVIPMLSKASFTLMYNITSVYPVPALHFPANTELVDRKIYCIILVKKCGGTECDYNKVDHLTIGEFGPILKVS